MQITWQDLVADIGGADPSTLLEDWAWLCPEPFALVLVSALGDAFLRSASGAIYWLDVGAALLTKIADDLEQFNKLRVEREPLNEWFVPQLIADLYAIGVNRQPFECFSYKKPPTLGGELSPDNLAPCSLSVHFSVLGQLQRKIRDLPAGTPISSIGLVGAP